MKNAIKKIKELKKELVNSYQKYFQTYKIEQEKYKKELLKVFNFENKYLKILDKWDNTVYMFCDWITEDNDDYNDNENYLYLRGYGFKYEFTPYSDSTYVIWDENICTEINISEAEVEKTFSNIQIISENDFDIAFNDMVKNLNKHHKKQLEKNNNNGD